MAPIKKTIHPTSVRVSDTCTELWNAASLQLGVSKAAIIEMAMREFAASHCINAASVQSGGSNRDDITTPDIEPAPKNANKSS